MSELEDVCAALNAINGDILRTSQELHTKAQAYSRASAQAAAGVRSAEGEAAAALTRAAAAFAAASQHCSRAAQTLVSASSEGQAFVRRTVGGGGGGGVATGASRETTREHDTLSEADRDALLDYTGFGYAEMNRALRGQTPMGEALSSRVAAVSGALARLPDKPGVSFRGTALSDEQLARYTPGAHLTEPGFTSSTRDRDKVFLGNTYFYIQGKHGKDVAPYSPISSESELLFDKESEFFVHFHEVDPSGNHVIMLIEV